PLPPRCTGWPGMDSNSWIVAASHRSHHPYLASPPSPRCAAEFASRSIPRVHGSAVRRGSAATETTRTSSPCPGTGAPSRPPLRDLAQPHDVQASSSTHQHVRNSASALHAEHRRACRPWFALLDFFEAHPLCVSPSPRFEALDERASAWFLAGIGPHRVGH